MEYPTFSEERKLRRKGYRVIVGIDEAGRGPLAGPVVAAAIYVDPDFKIKDPKLTIRDSKKLTPKQRLKAFKFLISNPDIEWGVGKVSEKIIDKINILEATKMAMKRAVKNLEKKYSKPAEFLLVDGIMRLDLNVPQKALAHADNRIFSCAAASLIAKVTRDRMMLKYDRKWPKYAFWSHKGYGTRFHLEMLENHGPCPIHRKSFRPLKNSLPK
jgi:ribonuclease HII